MNIFKFMKCNCKKKLPLFNELQYFIVLNIEICAYRMTGKRFSCSLCLFDPTLCTILDLGAAPCRSPVRSAYHWLSGF